MTRCQVTQRCTTVTERQQRDTCINHYHCNAAARAFRACAGRPRGKRTTTCTAPSAVQYASKSMVGQSTSACAEAGFSCSTVKDGISLSHFACSVRGACAGGHCLFQRFASAEGPANIASLV